MAGKKENPPGKKLFPGGGYFCAVFYIMDCLQIRFSEGLSYGIHGYNAPRYLPAHRAISTSQYWETRNGISGDRAPTLYAQYHISSADNRIVYGEILRYLPDLFEWIVYRLKHQVASGRIIRVPFVHAIVGLQVLIFPYR